MSISKPIRILVLSDTCNQWPYAPVTHVTPPPNIDVFIHCGNLTQMGGLSAFHTALENVRAIPADLRLVIAGNQDLDLDEAWVIKSSIARGLEDDILEELGTSMQCQNLFASAKENGVHYLREGVHEFELPSPSSGYRRKKTLKVYASPYTPAHNGYAFTYGTDEDRFNLPPSTPSNTSASTINLNSVPLHFPSSDLDMDLDLGMGGYTDVVDIFSVASVTCPPPRHPWTPPAEPNEPIPDNMDIVITHGPPKFDTLYYRLDMNAAGQHGGCQNLRKAVMRVKPKLHCFGHVREGRGAVEFEWASEGMHRGVEFDVGDREADVLEAGGSKKMSGMVVGGLGRTMFVNAAMSGLGSRGVLVEMEF